MIEAVAWAYLVVGVLVGVVGLWALGAIAAEQVVWWWQGGPDLTPVRPARPGPFGGAPARITR